MVTRVEPYIAIVDPVTTEEAVSKMKRIELLSRVSRMSHTDSNPDSHLDFITRRLNMDPPHLSVLRFAGASARCLTSRGITHELVRHHVGIDFMQESTRYVDYTEGGINVIYPPELNKYPGAEHVWVVAMGISEMCYEHLRGRGVPPQIARGVLPHDLAANISIKANLEAWRSLFTKRLHRTAHPHIRSLMWDALVQMRALFPPVFEKL